MFPRLLTFALLLCSLCAAAQFASPISFETSYEHVGGDEFKLIVKAEADKPAWSLYSQFTEEGGPVPTSFAWAEGDHYITVGKTEENGHLKEGMDDLFGVNVTKFLMDEPAYFIQTVKISDYGTPIETTVEYMCCDDEQCLPPTDEVLTWNIAPPAGDRGEVVPETKTPAPATPPQPATVPSVPTESTPARSAQTPIAQASFTAATYRVAGLAPSEATPLTWMFEAERVAEDEYLLRMTGRLLAGWTTYSMNLDPDVGPIPNAFVVENGEPLGEVTERSDQLKVAYDKVWDAEIAKILGGSVTYEQRVRATAGEILTGYIYFQTCDDETCLPPEEMAFELDLSGAEPIARLDGFAAGEAPATTDLAGNAEELNISVAFDPDPIGSCSIGAANTKGASLWGVFGLGFLGGLLALLMPCIFPMIPLTVSFFTKSEGSRGEGIRKAALYGFFIFLIYVLLSLPFHVVQGLEPNLLNNIASSVPLNVAFFLIFLFFAGSFFGFYELTLPESWSNRASQAEGTGGVAGVFFMALTLALVSFSCTGPILGSLLVESVSGGAWPLTAGMAGFGVALGLPFALFAAFPGFLNSMPKSGGWLNSVKVVLGFVEVALAFKFLSNADLVGEWDVLKIEPFLVIWILCAAGIAAYLFHLISFPLDGKRKKVGTVGAVVGASSLALAVYLVIGLTTAPDTGTYRVRNLLSGIAPPVCYNFFAGCDADRNLTPFKSLEEGLAYAREVDKPVMIDFTGYTCVNCRKMEENVWSEDVINRYLTEEYVIVSLYTDDRSELPESEHREVTRLDGSGRKKLIDQVGEKWHYFQQAVFERSSQPYYVLVSPDGKTLNAPVAYTPDVEEYENFLACGLSTYRKLSK